LYDIVQGVETFKHAHSIGYYRDKKYGFDQNNRFLDYRVNKELDLYTRVLNRTMRVQFLGGESTIDCKNITVIVKRINEIVNLFPCEATTDVTVDVDNSNETTWIINNPDCVNRQRWEFCLLKTAPSLSIQVTDVTSRCDIVYTLVKNKILCDITYGITTEAKDCNIDYEIYKEVIDCGIDPTVIRKVIDCGLDFRFSMKDTQPCIINGTESLTMDQINELIGEINNESQE
jgi:hypothetical protein